MRTSRNNLNPAPPLDDAAFEKGDDVRLAGPLASLAWLSVAALTYLKQDQADGYWVHSNATAMGFVVLAILLAARQVVIARRATRDWMGFAAPLLLFLAVAVEIWELTSAKTGSLAMLLPRAW
jgi:hypothetical protein